MIATAEFVGSLDDLAAIFDYSLPTIRKYMRRGAPEKTARGYSVPAWREWIAENTGPQEGEYSSEELAQAAARLKMATADLKEQQARRERLENDEMEGQLLRSDDVHQFIASAFLQVRARLETVPDEMQVIVPGELRSEAHRLAQDIVYRVLTELADLEDKGPWEKKGNDDGDV